MGILCLIGCHDWRNMDGVCCECGHVDPMWGGRPVRKCFIFDLDGTLCDITHRLHHIQDHSPKRWDEFYAACVDDKPIDAVLLVAQALMRAGERVLFVSGRSDAVVSETLRWLVDHGINVARTQLYMRKAGDHRPDHVVKGEMLDAIIEEGWQPAMAFDDRAQVVKMWRERGVLCAQVADGDF